MFKCVCIAQEFILTLDLNYNVFVDKCLFFHVPPPLIQTYGDRHAFYLVAAGAN